MYTADSISQLSDNHIKPNFRRISEIHRDSMYYLAKLYEIDDDYFHDVIRATRWRNENCTVSNLCSNWRELSVLDTGRSKIINAELGLEGISNLYHESLDFKFISDGEIHNGRWQFMIYDRIRNLTTDFFKYGLKEMSYRPRNSMYNLSDVDRGMHYRCLRYRSLKRTSIFGLCSNKKEMMLFKSGDEYNELGMNSITDYGFDMDFQGFSNECMWGN